MEIEDEMMIDDDQEILDIINFGFPRRRYQRFDHFDELDNYSFFRRFRLMKDAVLDILVRIEGELEFPNDLNDNVSPINQLLTMLRLYSCAGHQATIGDFIGVHQSSVSRIVTRVTDAIARLLPHYVSMPSEREQLQIQTGFYNIGRFPKVMGCVDGPHIKIQSPGGDDAEIYRNRKSYFSINTQVIGDHDLKIRDIVARWPGSAHDLTIFNSSRILAIIENNEFGNLVLLGDNGYANRNYLLTPLLRPATRGEIAYNRIHIRTRNSVERLIGVWKRRFPILAYGMRYKVVKSCNIIAATSVLHNIAINNNEGVPPAPENISEEELNYLVEQGQIEDDAPQNVQNNNQFFNYRTNLTNNFFAHL